jgi:hypothetical protein
MSPRVFSTRIILFLSFLTLGLTGQTAFAQFDPGCLNKVSPEMRRLETDTYLRLAYLMAWDQKKYDAVRAEKGPASGLPVLAGTVANTRDFADFKNRLEEEARRLRFAYDARQREALLVSALSDADFQTWGACWAEDHGGVFLRYKKADESKIVLELFYRPEPNAKTSGIRRAIMIGGTPVKPIKGAELKPGAPQSFEITRDPTIGFRVDMVTTTGQVGISIGLPLPEPAKETRLEIREAKTVISDGSDQPIEFPGEFVAPADGNYLVDVGFRLTPTKTTPACDQQGLDCYGICTKISLLVNGVAGPAFIDKWPPQCSGNPFDIRKPEDSVFDRRGFPVALKKGDTLSLSAAINSAQGKVKINGTLVVQAMPTQ